MAHRIEDLLIEAFLNQIKEQQPYSISFLDEFNELTDLNTKFHSQKDKPEYYRKYLLELGLLERMNPGDYILTTFAYEILNTGGWLRHVNELNEENREQKERQRIKDESARIDLKLKKWQIKLFWPLAILGAIGGILSILQVLKII